MDSIQLDRSLRSIGKECFVNYFELFADTSLSSTELVELLMKREGYEESGSRTRVSQSRRIIKEGKVKEALNMILSSDRLSGAVKVKAARLLTRAI